MIRNSLVILSHKIIHIFPLKLNRGDYLYLKPLSNRKFNKFTLINDNEDLISFKGSAIRKKDLKVNLLLINSFKAIIQK